jgi:hypothetical protein
MNNKDNSFFHLIENDNDTYEDLKTKNKKLRDIIVRITEELKSLNSKIKTMQKEFAAEKQMMLDKLDKITNNYKMYAEGYKEKAILKKDIGTLMLNYKQNNRVLNSFKDSFMFLLKKNMNIYNLCKKFEINSKKNNDEYDEFLDDIKNKLLNNIIKFKKSIDMINFPDFYKEYLSFVEYEGEEQNNKNKYLDKFLFKKVTNKNKKRSNSKNSKNNKHPNNRRSFGKYNNKYSFTKIDINSNNYNVNENSCSSNNLKNNEDKKSWKNKYYKETNFYKNYLCQDNDISKNNTENSNLINYSEYGNL